MSESEFLSRTITREELSQPDLPLMIILARTVPILKEGQPFRAGGTGPKVTQKGWLTQTDGGRDKNQDWHFD